MPKIILKNIKGRHGTDGVTGLKGEKGDKGDKGDQGTQGVQGELGTAGLRGLQGEHGAQGQKGLKGLDGISGGLGGQGEKGEKGEKGDKGDVPNHKWVGESLQFEKPDGSYGKLVNLKGSDTGSGGFVGGGPSSAGIQYKLITTATYTVSERKLVQGHNIFGVNYAGNVTITIPAEVSPEKLIVIKDESGNAGSNNITIETA
jgi:hypothetical protein